MLRVLRQVDELDELLCGVAPTLATEPRTARQQELANLLAQVIGWLKGRSCLLRSSLTWSGSRCHCMSLLAGQVSDVVY